MPSRTTSYSITIRLHLDRTQDLIGQIVLALQEAGAVVTAIDTPEAGPTELVVDVTCLANGPEHSEELARVLDEIAGVSVHRVSDRTFLMHLGGKIEVTSRVSLRNRDDLSMAYTPGVGRISQAIVDKPADLARLTIKGNSVAVVTDGSAVLGLGNLGPGAALPVMEGKAALFKSLAGINAWPICLDTQDVDEIVRTVQVIAPGFGGINLEDISAPRCFEVERRLREVLDIPVFHDDQHGTAIVVLAALTNALKVVEKALPEVRIVVSGGGAAGSAIVQLLLRAGAVEVLVFDREGILSGDDSRLAPSKAELAAITNPRRERGGLPDALAGADVFIGVSAPGLLHEEWLPTMAPRSIVFALANPVPEIDPLVASRYAEVTATGRTDYPNQINNVLAFPGVFRGLLDARASHVTPEMLLGAAAAIAGCVSERELGASFVVPSVFDDRVAPAVAAAIRDAAGWRKPPET